MSQQNLAEQLNLEKNTISSYETKGVNPKIDTLIQISDIFSVKIDNLLKIDLEKKLATGYHRAKNILVPIKAQAGYLTNFFLDDVDSIQYLELPFFNTSGKKRTFQVEGNSMYPMFEEGDYVVCEGINSPEYVKDESIYVFVSQNDGIIIKSIFNDKNRKLYQLISANPDYPPIIRHWNEIKEVWQVSYRIIKRN